MIKRESKWILDTDGKAIPCSDPLKWAEWFETHYKERVVKQTRLINPDTQEEVLISTVFLGLDPSWGLHDDPVLWETMIFGEKHDEYQHRYTSAAVARRGHERAVRLARQSLAETWKSESA